MIVPRCSLILSDARELRACLLKIACSLAVASLQTFLKSFYQEPLPHLWLALNSKDDRRIFCEVGAGRAHGERCHHMLQVNSAEVIQANRPFQ